MRSNPPTVLDVQVLQFAHLAGRIHQEERGLKPLGNIEAQFQFVPRPQGDEIRQVVGGFEREEVGFALDIAPKRLHQGLLHWDLLTCDRCRLDRWHGRTGPELPQSDGQ